MNRVISRIIGGLLVSSLISCCLCAQNVDYYKKKGCEEAYLYHLLLLACGNDDDIAVKILIAKGVDTSGHGYKNYVNCLGMSYEFTSPLMRAVEDNNVRIVKILLKHKADPNILEGEGETPIVEAVSNGNIEIVKLLLKYGAKINIRSFYKTPIEMAKKFKRYKILELLKKHESNPSKKTK